MLSPVRRPVPSYEPPAPYAYGRRHLALLVVIAGLAMIFLIAVAQLFWARQHLKSGAADLAAAIRIVHSPSRLKDPVARHRAVADLNDARNAFAGARNDLVLWSPVLANLGWVPVLGHQLSSASPAATAAYFGTASALDIVRGITPLWPVLTSSHDPGPVLHRIATGLTPGRPRFQLAESEASQGVTALHALPSSTGSYTLDRSEKKLRRDLPRLRTAATLLAVMPRILGVASAQRYLFCWENATEIRPVGGFVGAADLVTVRHGYVTRKFTGSALAHEIDFPHLPAFEAEMTAETSLLFRDSNFSPDFPTSARLERWFYGRDTGTWPNTVVDFVDQGVPDILRATGPVYVPQYHVTVNSTNSIALAERFARPHPVPYPSDRNISRDTIRKRFLGFEFSAIFKRLENLPIARWPALASAMTSAIRKHDILIYSRDRSVERAVRQAGAGGALKPVNGDFLYIVDDNRSYNKINPYVHEWATYDTEVTPSMWLDSTVTIHYHLNPSPPDIEGTGPYYGYQGPYQGRRGNKHDYFDFVRVYVPAGALQPTVSGLKLVLPTAAQQAYDYTQFAGYFLLRAGRSTSISLHYEIPANGWNAGSYKRYALTVPRQPGANLKSVKVYVNGVAGISLTTQKGRRLSTYQSTLPMTRDRRISLGIEGNVHPTTEPVVRSWPDPFVPWRWLHTPGHPF